MVQRDTIVAPATPRVPSAIALLRVSGPLASRLMECVCRRRLAPRRASLVQYRTASGDLIDEGLGLFFPGPHSATGEDLFEAHLHGSPAVVEQLLEVFLRLGARLAQPGEFTRRGLESGRLDLTQAEGIVDLIHAKSQRAARAAAASMEGAFGRAVREVQAQLTELRIRLEACLDFPEEEGVDHLALEGMGARVHRVQTSLDGLLCRLRAGQRLREGLRVALLGPPNVGKSSLFNALADEEVAIVTPVAGTTRDRLRQSILVDGLAVELVDTAGLRDATDEIERIGIERSWESLRSVDLVLWLGDASGAIPDRPDYFERLQGRLAESTRAESDAALDPDTTGPRVLRVLNKVDLLSESVDAEAWDVVVAARSGQGLDRLRQLLLQVAGLSSQSEEEDVWMGRARHLAALRSAQSLLQGSAAELESGHPELAADTLRLAQVRLSELTGELTSDDLLGKIFSEFCIGK